MGSELDELAMAAGDLAAAAANRQELGARASRLAERLARRRFHVSVLGEFKRGKSTLINAMLGTSSCPPACCLSLPSPPRLATARPGPRSCT